MQIFIKTLTGKTIVVDVEAEESVLSVKKKIAHQTGIAVSAQRLIIAGRQIYDYKNIGSYNPQQINCIHLVPRLNNEFNFEIDFESDDVELLWTVNYLDENEGAFPQETYELIGSKNLEDAYGSFQKRRSLQAPNQATYLALTAVKKSDLDFTAKSSATHKFQPERGGKVDSYLSLESAMPIQCLMVAVQNRDGSFEIMQSPNKNIHHSTKYQQKYSQLRAKIQAEISQAQPVKTVEIAKPVQGNVVEVAPVQANPKPQIQQAASMNLDDPRFRTVQEVIDQEIDFNMPEDNDSEELEALVSSLNEFLAKLPMIEKIPFEIKRELSVVNTLCRHLNESRRLIANEISDEDLIAYVELLIRHHIQLIAPNDLVEDLAAASLEALERVEEVEKAYLMLDHGGVLDGNLMDFDQITDNDLVITKHPDLGMAQVLKNGVSIVNNLNELVNRYGYKIVFHSKNSLNEQGNFLTQLENACISKGLNFPLIHALGVYDSKNYPSVPSNAPQILHVHGKAQNDISIAVWGGDDDNGKASLRRALEAMLQIKPQSRANSVVFDDGKSIFRAARDEGYQAYLINHKQGLDEALSATLRNAQANAHRGIAAPEEALSQRPVLQQPVELQESAKVPSLAPDAFAQLPASFVEFVSSQSEVVRGIFGGISTDEYWVNLEQDRREQFWRIFQSQPMPVAAAPALQSQSVSRAAAPKSQSSFFQPADFYSQLTTEQKASVAVITQDARNMFGGLITSDYYNNLSSQQRQAILADIPRHDQKHYFSPAQ